MTEEHPLLAAIRNAVAASGVHSQHWGELRRTVFPDTSWAGLKAWCTDNTFVCELALNQSSRDAQVQFRRQKKAAL